MKLVAVAFLIAAINTANAQKLSPEWACASQALADAAKKSKHNSFSKEEQAELDEATRRCMQPVPPSQTLEQRLGVEIEEYLSCTLIASSLLDDGISDAATIAVGAKSQCYAYLEALAKEPTGKSATNWGETLHPGVVNKILAHRATLRTERFKPPPPRTNSKQM